MTAGATTIALGIARGRGPATTTAIVGETGAASERGRATTTATDGRRANEGWRTRADPSPWIRMGHGYGSWQEVCLALPKWVMRSGDDSSGGRHGVRLRSGPCVAWRARLPRAVRCVVGSRATPCDGDGADCGVKPRAYTLKLLALVFLHIISDPNPHADAQVECGRLSEQNDAIVRPDSYACHELHTAGLLISAFTTPWQMCREHIARQPQYPHQKDVRWVESLPDTLASVPSRF